MHITHIQGGLAPEHGGPTQSLANYCGGQAALGHKVSVWVLEGFPNTSPAIRLQPPVEMRVFQAQSPPKLGRSTEMSRQLKEASSPDIYHLHGAWLRAMHYGAVEARRRSRPYLLEVMGMYEPWQLRQKWFQKRIARWWFQDRIFREAACLHVNSTQEAKYIRRLGFKPPIAIIPVGVDLDEIVRRKATLFQNSPWQELENKPYILYLSRLHPKKGLDLLLRSWAKVARDFAGWRLVIAGTGMETYVRACRQMPLQLGISEQCLWVGHVDELQKSWLFSHAHCYILPTQSENFGNVVAEALAHGTPVITTRHTPWTDLEKHGCGWAVDNTEAELADALRTVLNLDVLARQGMGDRGEQLVSKAYSLQLVLKNINAVYDWLLTDGRVPDCVEIS
jgi:glycosyltransferase involved in cell wall biosynthesis